MLNIQFMTEEQKKVNGQGREVYIPDYDKMLENACCEEERECIRLAKETMERWDDGFAFAIVYTDCYEAIKQDVKTGAITREKSWHFLQHPWYRNGYQKISEAEMLKEIGTEYLNHTASTFLG